MSKTKTIVVVGNEGTVGNAVAKKFTEEGLAVIKISHSEKSSLSSNSEASYVCDVTDRGALKTVVDKIIMKYAQLDYAFIDLEPSLEINFEDTSIADWKETLDITLKGAANACACIAPYMVQRKTGKITLFVADYSKCKGDCVLNATASGTLHGFGKSFGVEMAPNNVLVNVLSANTPFDLSTIVCTAGFLGTDGEYISSQVISINGKERS